MKGTKALFARLLTMLSLFVLGGLVTGCADGTVADESVGRSRQAVTASVMTNKTAYGVGETITVTFSGLPGNPYDWLAIAPAGSEPTTYLSWRYASGETSGALDLDGVGIGTYVVRAFADNSYDVLGESAEFVVAEMPTVATNKSSYAAGETVHVTFSNLPGNENDWIAIAPAGSPETSYLSWRYTGGETSGALDLPGVDPGTYVVRVFVDNSYDVIAVSDEFAVGTAASVTTDKASYTVGESVQVSFSGLPGGQYDWVGIAPAGSPSSTYLSWSYTGGTDAGSVTLDGVGPGTYVARAFANNGFEVLGESAEFVVGDAATISTNKSSYAANETIAVTFAGLPGNATDWIAIAPAGAPATTYLSWRYTEGATSGTLDLDGVAAGTYVARAFANNGYTVVAESAEFTVTSGGGSGIAVTTNASSYTTADTITVSWDGLPGNATDWISIAAVGSSPQYIVIWQYTGGQAAGSVAFSAAELPPGYSYVARAYVNDSFDLVGESAPFTVN